MVMSAENRGDKGNRRNRMVVADVEMSQCDCGVCAGWNPEGVDRDHDIAQIERFCPACIVGFLGAYSENRDSNAVRALAGEGENPIRLDRGLNIRKSGRVEIRADKGDIDLTKD
jgi:hypothetical protein